MQPYETLGLPSPEECAGIAGLTVGLVLVTVGVVLHVFVWGTVASFSVVVLGLFISWVSFIYCGLWAQRRVPEE